MSFPFSTSHTLTMPPWHPLTYNSYDMATALIAYLCLKDFRHFLVLMSHTEIKYLLSLIFYCCGIMPVHNVRQMCRFRKYHFTIDSIKTAWPMPFASSVPKGCKSGFVTYRYHVVQQAMLQQVVKYCYWLVMFYRHKNMFLDTLLVQGLLGYKTVVGL